MKKTLLSALLATSLAAIAGTAAADSGKIAFEGQITESACSIGGGELGTDMKVDMGRISTNQFTEVGKRSVAQKFEIALLDCNTAVASTASIAFAPGAGSAIASRMLGLENANGAKGVAIALTEADGTNVIVGGAAKSYALQDGTNIFTFNAQYESTEAAVVAGPANARAVFEVTYS